MKRMPRSTRTVLLLVCTVTWLVFFFLFGSVTSGLSSVASSSLPAAYWTYLFASLLFGVLGFLILSYGFISQRAEDGKSGLGLLSAAVLIMAFEFVTTGTAAPVSTGSWLPVFFLLIGVMQIAAALWKRTTLR